MPPPRYPKLLSSQIHSDSASVSPQRRTSPAPAWRRSLPSRATPNAGLNWPRLCAALDLVSADRRTVLTNHLSQSRVTMLSADKSLSLSLSQFLNLSGSTGSTWTVTKTVALQSCLCEMSPPSSSTSTTSPLMQPQLLRRLPRTSTKPIKCAIPHVTPRAGARHCCAARNSHRARLLPPSSIACKTLTFEPNCADAADEASS